MALELVPLAQVVYTPREFITIGKGAAGLRIVGEISEAEVKGDRLTGQLRGYAAADWILVGPGAAVTIDVRCTLETHDGALILVHYLGRGDARQGPRSLPYYSAPMFETGDERYSWLNYILAVGKAEFVGDKVVYQWYELR